MNKSRASKSKSAQSTNYKRRKTASAAHEEAGSEPKEDAYFANIRQEARLLSLALYCIPLATELEKDYQTVAIRDFYKALKALEEVV